MVAAINGIPDGGLADRVEPAESVSFAFRPLADAGLVFSVDPGGAHYSGRN